MTKQTLKKNKSLRLETTTIRSLSVVSDAELARAAGGLMHTSFSCGRDLCTTHGGA